MTDDRELTVEQGMFLALRKEEGLTLSRKGTDILEFSYLSSTNELTKMDYFWGYTPWPLEGFTAQKWPSVTAYDQTTIL